MITAFLLYHIRYSVNTIPDYLNCVCCVYCHMTSLSKLLSHYIVLLSFCVLFYFLYVPFVFVFMYVLFFLSFCVLYITLHVFVISCYVCG